MSAKHTPGPWAIRYDYVVQAQSFDGGRLVPVAQPYGVNSDGTDLFANARLIAAAPDLLEALSKFVEFAEQYGEVVFSGGGMPVIDAMNACTTKARAAITKATGEKMP